MSEPKTGKQMKLYRNTGTDASPTWVLVCDISDVNINDLSVGTAELKRRCSDWVKALPTLFGLVTLEFTLLHGLDPTTFTAIRQDFFAKTVRQWAVMDGLIDTVGSEGLILPGLLQNFPWNQPLEDVSGHDIQLVTGYLQESSVEIDPYWLVVSS